MFLHSPTDIFRHWQAKAASGRRRRPAPAPEHQAALGKLAISSSDLDRTGQRTLEKAFRRHGQTLNKYSVGASQAFRLISNVIGQADRGARFITQAARRLDTTLNRLSENDRTELAIELAQIRLNLPELLPGVDTHAVQDALEQLQVELFEDESNQPPASSAPQQSASPTYAALSGAAFPKATKPRAPTFGSIAGPSPGPVNLTV
ncbi:MAG: hypothetical protein QF473_00245 [Planctomycetota bacterium]|jgi:hypothetical protein|nr:hypothetical protein [Planctomycetota bacterium]